MFARFTVGDGMKNYDIWFNLAHPANLVVAANSQEEAKDIAEDILVNMNRDELMERIEYAIDFMGVQVVNVDEI